MEQDVTKFYIVGIGTSAGGLETLEKFFSNMAADSGLAFVVVQHLSPDYKSHMVQLLSKHTAMPVYEVNDGVQIVPNCIYLITPKKNMTIFHRKLYLRDYGPEPGLNLPIDVFLRSLAEDVSDKAIAIILSGTGSDGTRGIRAIKEAGGMVMAQDDSAKFDGMPRSAVATQLVDYILPPERMPIELLKFVQHPRAATDAAMQSLLTGDEDSLSKIFALLRTHNGVDFTYYKPNTVVRRIEHRMGINQIEKLSNYLQYLYQSKTEVQALHKELLIGVTKFFRDTEAFQFVQDKVIPAIFEGKGNRDQIRVWVASCSTGEEAYSLAILIREYMERTKTYLDVKIFATDIDQDALDFAGRGAYSESIAADVSWERLRNFFIKKGETYEIMRQVREMVIFAQQNLIIDPPFSKIDLVTCRNVLIYFQPILQRKVLSTFQFALKPEGFLFLGSSETVGDQDTFFLCRHNKWKVYQHKGFRPSFSDQPHSMPLERAQLPAPKSASYVAASTNLFDNRRTAEDTFKNLITGILPPCVIVDKNYDIVHAFGEVGQFLQLPTGYNISMNLLKMAHQDLAVVLSTALHKAFKDNQKITYNNIHLKNGAQVRQIHLTAKPIVTDGHTRLGAVIFELITNVETQENVTKFDFDHNASQRITDLEQELQYTKENLQATIEELETSNEELQATNEELLAANEELQSTNEELQSVNEELITVNSEYQAKIQELIDLNNDLNNLFNSTDIGIIFLDENLRVRKFTPAAQQNINLLAQDIGRPLQHLSHNFHTFDIVNMSEQVIKTLEQVDEEVQNSLSRWFRLKILPYRTLENTVKGVIITLMDITALKRTEMALTESEEHFRRLTESTVEGVVFLEGGYVIDSNPAFSSMFGYKSAEIVGRNFVDFIAPQFQAQLLSFSQTNYDKPYQISGVKKDGTVFPLQIQGKETHYQDRLIRVKVVHDLTLQCNSCPVYNHVSTRHHKEDNLLLPEK